MKDFDLTQYHWRPTLNILEIESGKNITYHGDGKSVWQKYTIVDTFPDGNYEEFHRNGNKMSSGKLVNGLKTDKWVYYHDNGEIFFEDVYKDDELNGKSIRYRGDSILEYVGEYKNNKKNGKWTYYHDNGNRNCEGNYKNDEPIGKWKFFHHENENIYYITNYKKGIEVGEKIEYNLEGQLKRKFVVNNSIKDGYYIEYDKNDSSKIIQEGEYKNDKLNGEWKVYESEQVVISKMYVDDKLDGDWLEFYLNSKKKLISKYKNNKLHGEYIKFNEFDKISEKSLYKNGKLSGDFLSYHKNGVNWKKYKYKDGKLHGEYLEFDDHGEVQCKGEYDSDNKINEWKWYSTFNGQSYPRLLKIENFNKDGKLHGESILYYQDESVVEQGNYKNGKKDGEWIFRGENGAYQKYNYENDIRVGKWESYDDEGILLYDGIIDKKTVGYHSTGSTYEIIEYEFYKNKPVVKSREQFAPVSQTLVVKEEYKSGQKIEENGWYDDGSKKYYSRFKGGLEDGESIRWYRNGNKWKVTNYLNGKRNGKSEEYFINGTHKLILHYVDGTKDGQYDEWFKGKDKKRSRGTMVDNKMDGKWEYWYHNGQKECELFLENGNLLDGTVWLDSGVEKTEW